MRYQSLINRAGHDYSEEAIPERDPAYHMPVGTLSETQTVEALPPAARLDLLCLLKELGMSAGRAVAVVNL